MWIERDLAKRIKNLAEQKPALILTGARQVGKTELLKRSFPGHHFVSLDLPSMAARADEDGLAFLESHPAPVIIDEAQYAPGLFRPLKVKIDADRQSYGQYLLSGSQRFQLMKEASESLAGRLAVMELETLSLTEIRAAGISLTLPELIHRGGYPELYRTPALATGDFYGSYVATYLERDLRSLTQVNNLRDFERFIRACALRSGQLLNRSELARDVGISPTTANHWVSLLQTAGIVRLLEPWFANQSRSLTKSPKLYFCDTGLLCFLMNIFDTDALLASPLLGAIWETFVFAHLRKHFQLHHGSSPIYFYRDRKLEVDFLVPTGGRYLAYEAKWSQSPGEKDVRALEAFAAIAGAQNIISQKVVCRTPEPFPINKTTQATNLESVFDGSIGSDLQGSIGSDLQK